MHRLESFCVSRDDRIGGLCDKGPFGISNWAALARELKSGRPLQPLLSATRPGWATKEVYEVPHRIYAYLVKVPRAWSRRLRQAVATHFKFTPDGRRNSVTYYHEFALWVANTPQTTGDPT